VPDISLEPIPNTKHYSVIRKPCPSCKENFKFIVDDKEIREVKGAKHNPQEKTVECDVCHGKFKYELFEPKLHVG